MKKNYNLHHRLIACMLLVSLFLQGCGNVPKQVLSIAEERLDDTQVAIKPIGVIKQQIAEKLKEAGWDVTNFYEKDAELKVKAIQRYGNFSKMHDLSVHIDRGLDLKEVARLSSEEQKRFIHIKRSENSQLSQVLVFKEGLLGGMMEGEEERIKQPAQELTDITELRRCFYKGYLEITPENCIKLIEVSQKYEGPYKDYEGGVFVKGWETSKDLDSLVDLLLLFSKIKKFKINCAREDKAELGEVIVRAIQFYKDLVELDLSGCSLSDSILEDIIESIVVPARLTVLNVSNNNLSTELISSLEERFSNAQVRSRGEVTQTKSTSRTLGSFNVSIENSETGSPIRRNSPYERLHLKQVLSDVPQEEIEYGKKLGAGGMGIVYQGTYQGKIVAIKQLLSASSEQVAAFEKEAIIMANHRHNNIVAFLGFCRAQNALVMEYVSGGCLASLLKSSEKLPWQLRYQIGLDVCEGITYLHDCGIVHSDLKSDNILVDENKRAKVTDFGISALKSENSTFGERSGWSYRWIAPEIYHTQKNSKPGDVYSYGMVLWQLGARREPFASISNLFELAKHISAGNHEVISEDTPLEIRKVIEKCWLPEPPLKKETDTQQRPTMKQIRYLLEAGLERKEEDKEKEKTVLGKEKEEEELLAELKKLKKELEEVKPRHSEKGKEKNLEKEKDNEESLGIIPISKTTSTLVATTNQVTTADLLNTTPRSARTPAKAIAVSPLPEPTTPLQKAATLGNSAKVLQLLKNGLDVNERSKDSLTVLHYAVCYNQPSVVQTLLAQGADVNVVDKSGATPLHVAVEKGYIEVVKLLVKKRKNVFSAMFLGKGINIEAVDNGGNTSLHLATKNGHKEIVAVLLEHGANVNAVNDKTSLHIALEKGHTEIAALLIEQKRVNLNVTDRDARTPLHLAVARGYQEIVFLLVRKVTNANAQDKDLMTPLHIALEGGHKEIAALLIEQKGINLNVTDRDTKIPLHLAVVKGYQDIVSLLVRKVTNVNAQDKDLMTPLHIALEGGHKEIAALLIEQKRANLNVTDSAIRTPLHLAAAKGYQEIVSLLIRKVTNVNAQDKDLMTPVHLAALGGHKEVVALLIEEGVDLNVIGIDARTPLHCAASGGHQDVVALLIDGGANLGDIKNNNNTLLHSAAFGGNKEIVAFLLDKGADVNAVDQYRYTPLYHAAIRGHKEVVGFLIEKGADVNLGSPIYQVAANGHKEVVALLMEKGANFQMNSLLNGASCNGHKEVVAFILEKERNVGVSSSDPSHLSSSDLSSSLDLAAQRGHKEIVALLIEKGADVNVCKLLGLAAENGHKEVVAFLLEKKGNVGVSSSDLSYALCRAAEKGRKEVVALLIAKGADVNTMRSDDKYTPLHLAAYAGHKDVVALLIEKGAHVNTMRSSNDKYTPLPLHLAARAGHKDVVALLIEKGANVNAFGTFERKYGPPLYIAACADHKDVVALLIEKGANVNATDENKRTALHHAAGNFGGEGAALLIEKGAHVNATDEDNDTPLHFAARGDNEAMVAFLIGKGAGVNASNRDGWTPLHCAVWGSWEWCKEKIVALLIEKGARVNAISKDGKTPLKLATENNYTEVVALLQRAGGKE